MKNKGINQHQSSNFLLTSHSILFFPLLLLNQLITTSQANTMAPSPSSKGDSFLDQLENFFDFSNPTLALYLTLGSAGFLCLMTTLCCLRTYCRHRGKVKSRVDFVSSAFKDDTLRWIQKTKGSGNNAVGSRVIRTRLESNSIVVKTLPTTRTRENTNEDLEDSVESRVFKLA